MTRKTTFSACRPYFSIISSMCFFLFSYFTSFAQQWTVLGNEQAISSVASSHTSIAVVNDGENFIPYVAFTESGVPKVKKRLTDGTWVQVGTDLATSASYTKIHTNAIDELYVTYIDLSAGSKLAIKKYDTTTGTWTTLNPDDSNTLYVSTGNANGMSSISQYGSTHRCSMAFDSFNIPYIAYSEAGMIPHVKKFNGTSWENVGTGAVSGDFAAAVSLAIDSTDKPWLVYSKLSTTASSTGNMTLYNFNGNSWSLVTSNPIPTVAVRHTNIAVRDNNSLCIVYFNIASGANNRATAILYDKLNDTWSSGTYLAARDSPNISLINDKSGNLYCSFIDFTSSTNVYPTRVRFLAAGSTSWTELKDPAVIRGVDEPTGWPAIAIGNADYPYLAYTKINSNAVNTPIVRMYTPPPPPAVLTTNSITNITSTTAVTGGNITSDGGQTITERGVVYSNSNPNPTTADSKVTDITGGIGNFSVTLTNLKPGTFYYVRAYAINGSATSYGNTFRLSSTQTPDVIVTTPKQVEFLNRGLIAIQKSGNNIYLSWRLLGNDPSNISFNVYRNGVKINTTPITNSTNYIDNTTLFNNSYTIKPVINNVEGIETAPVTVWAKNQLSVPIQIPPSGTLPDARTYTYTANDASVGDVDGDGIYEIILRWEPTIVNDNAGGYSGKQIFDCYKLDGTRLWRIDLGINMNSGPHFNPFMVYDFDGDGKAEIILKTADGTIDGLGNVIGNASVDYRNSYGWVQQGPEFLTVFNGLTGAAMATVNYEPSRGKVTDWGDDYGNRQDRFVSAVAYLDGAKPSLIVGRGYYNKLVRAAYNWRNGQLTMLWKFDSKDSTNPEYNSYSGQGNHQMTIGDVDGDGKDEIINGSSAINDDGKPLWTYGMGHGDALHMTDMDLDRPGMEIWINLESPSSHNNTGLRQYDAKTGQTNWGIATGTADVGRSMAADIDPNYKGYEIWGSSGGKVYDVKGNAISSSVPSYNFGIWWDGDLGRELFDRGYIDKWNPVTKSAGRLFTIYNQTAKGLSTNNSTKSNPCLQADIFGDWREEVILRESDNSALVIFSTDIPTTYRIPTLMHDPQYRTAIAWQNSAYNQPPYPSYYIGYDMDVNNIATAKIQVIDNAPLSVSGITRPTNAAATTNANNVTFNVDFSKNVTGVESTDFTLTTTGNTTGTIGTVTAISGASYQVTITNISGDGTIRLDLKASGTGIIDQSSNALTTGYTNGEFYTLDQTAPTLSSVLILSNNSTSTLAKTGDNVSLNFTASEKITNLTVTIAGKTVPATNSSGNNYSANYQLTNTDIEGVIPFTIQFNDIVGNTGISVNTSTDTKTVTFDRTIPTLSTVTFTSNNSNAKIAREGDIVTLNFTSSETIGTPTVTIAGHTVSVSTVATNSFKATYTMIAPDAEGVIPFTINFTDLAGNSGTQVTTATSTLTFKHTTPKLKVYVETPTCPGKDNGKISIATDMNTYTYNLTITGNGVNLSSTNQSITTSTNWEKTDFSKGSYLITISIPSISFEESYGVVVNEIKDITAKRSETNKTVSYTVSGSNSYIFTINGVSKTYNTDTTEESKIEIDGNLLKATNTVTIETNNDCQGLIQDNFNLSSSISVYPNPTTDIVSISGIRKGLIQVYSNNGTLLQENNAENTKSIDFTGYASGMYLIKITQETSVETFKVILK